jgi:hypothetical protein
MRPRLVIAVAGIAAAGGLATVFWPREAGAPLFAPTQAASPAAPAPPVAVSEASASRLPSGSFGKGASAGRVLKRLGAWRLIADPREAIRELDELVALVDAGDAKDIMDALSSHEAEGRVGTLILGRWLSLDPSAAIAWLMNREVIPGGQATLVAKTLLEVPGRLQGYLEGVKDEGRRQQLLSSAGFEIVATDPRQALVLAEGMKPGELRSALVQNSVFEWGRRNPEEAKRWVEAVDDPALRERLAAWGAKGWAEKDARGAAEWLVSSVKSPELLGEIVPAVVRCWAERDPAAAAEWVGRFPDGPVREQALENLMGWATPDAVGEAPAAAESSPL